MKPATQPLETERLILRRWREEDAAPFAAINADPDVTALLLGPLPREMSDGQIARFEAHFQAEGFGLWAVERRADAQLVGFAGLQRVPFEAAFTPAIEIGWRFAASAWGQGFATEAAAAALADAERRLSVRQVVAFTVPANVRSQRVMQKLGFVRDPDADFHHPRLPEDHPNGWHWLFRWQSRSEN